MNKLQIHTSAIAAIIGFILTAGTSAYPQQLQLSSITEQPQDQLAQVGTDVTLSFGAPNVLACQWLCNGIELDGQTNSVLTIKNVQIADAGYYSCIVATPAQLEETSSASLEVFTAAPAGAPGFAPDGFLNIVVYAAPIVSTGSLGTCPGKYKGYVNYTTSTSNFWGWTPSTNTTVYTATDTSRTNTKVEYVGGYGDSGCAKTTVTIPHPTFSPAYAFAIYFTNNVPTTNYPITLTGFNP